MKNALRFGSVCVVCCILYIRSKDDKAKHRDTWIIFFLLFFIYYSACVWIFFFFSYILTVGFCFRLTYKRCLEFLLRLWCWFISILFYWCLMLSPSLSISLLCTFPFNIHIDLIQKFNLQYFFWRCDSQRNSSFYFTIEFCFSSLLLLLEWIKKLSNTSATKKKWWWFLFYRSLNIKPTLSAFTAQFIIPIRKKLHCTA